MRTLFLLACAALAANAGAQQVHKCTVDGKVTYSASPCERGTASTVAVPETPPPDPAAAARYQAQKQELRQLEKERHKREAAQEKQDAVANKEAAAYRKRCGKLKLEQKWAEEDARGATGANVERDRKRASRVADKVALECGR